MKNRTYIVAGTAIFSALSSVCEILPLDLPILILGHRLTLDPTGIPIFLATLLYGLRSGVIVDLMAALTIIAKGGLIGGFMKGAAEFSTILPIPILYRRFFRDVTGLNGKILIYTVCPALRIVVMDILCLVVLSPAVGIPFDKIMGLLPAISIFNLVQAIVNISVSLLVFSKVKGVYLKG